MNEQRYIVREERYMTPEPRTTGWVVWDRELHRVAAASVSQGEAAQIAAIYNHAHVALGL